ncbi:ganglioside GM2 activator [Trichosurus vulpecula]|uniref:ganglioside GM2 activator n=1 Tax=Trichosurus vulpecula TaxID=9337 RepID=UPI00186AD978|nr:ganglioside GM2 activator [Trichosurus vulpecula]
MKSLALGVLLVVSLPWPAPADKGSLHLGQVSDFSWENCDGGQDPVVITSLEVEPVPISIPGSVTVGMETRTNILLTSPLKTVVTLEKEMTPGFWLPIPCVKKIGSCTYRDICETIDTFIPPGEACPEPLRTYGLPCHCPFKKGTYSLPKTSFQIPPVKLPPSLSSGNYRAQIVLSNSDARLGCFKIKVSLTDN